jgi:hypothetical protein
MSGTVEEAAFEAAAGPGPAPQTPIALWVLLGNAHLDLL